MLLTKLLLIRIKAFFGPYLDLRKDFWIIKNENNLQYIYNKFILFKKYIIDVCFFM